MNFKDLKVKNKITVAVIGIAILASISGIVSAFMMSGIQKQYDNALERFGFAQGDVGMVLSSLAQLDGAVHDAIGYLNADAKKEAANKTTELVATIDKYMAEVESSLVSDASKATFADAQTAWSSYQSITKNLLESALGVTDVQSIGDEQQRLRNELLPVYERMYKNISALMELKMEQGDETRAEVNRSALVSLIIVISLIVLAMLLGLFISAKISNGIAKPLAHCVKRLQDLAHGDLHSPLPQVDSKDEIGDMGRHAVEVAETIKELIATDALTGLFNRRAGRIELAKCMEKVHANRDRCVTVAMGDIDFFKQINDRYGHECGDKVLASIADIFKKHLENKGFPVRWGGEEFLLVFKEDKESALASLQKIMEEICNKTFDYEDCRFSVTITFGVARYDGRDSMDSLIKKADDLLYRGKAEGRNRIVV